ncbi:hypothetical protein K402DRAFT_333127 [Aulographum hederae CBS 113979]|uniref:Uncharacterized protein n=1 Tax=Aulographum hederae CBS 113979 TaxID=1176131 RepID=A0A6G1GZC3_9PEZI|nr:hypothetical protein K402DRAFT_333127 [Aulographum hederae CBS 113979]
MPRPDDFDNHAIPADAKLLLDHCRDFLDVLSPLRNQKSFWKVLHLPSALTTLSEYVLWKSAGHARLSLLYSLLSVSAFHLDRTSGNEQEQGYWWSVGESYNTKARRELQWSLREELVGPKKAKYKDLAMAMLTMVTVAVTNGKLADARLYLLDAERLITLRGIQKTNKSRKVRLLHTQFLFLRVIEESSFTYTSREERDLTALVAQQKPTRFPSLVLHNAGDAPDKALDPFAMDSLIEGPDANGWSLFSQIYGVPESLVVLMSHAVYLSREKNIKRELSRGGATNAGDFEQRCKGVEDLLCNWTLPECIKAMGSSSTLTCATEAEVQANKSIMEHSAGALHAALMIYFYRLVRDVNPVMVQHLVKQVLEHLEAAEYEKEKHSVNSAGIMWPGFIAACEALDETTFDEAVTWLRTSGTQSGIRAFDRAADAATKVWKARKASRTHVDWTDVLENCQISLVLS